MSSGDTSLPRQREGHRREISDLETSLPSPSPTEESSARTVVSRKRATTQMNTNNLREDIVLALRMIQDLQERVSYLEDQLARLTNQTTQEAPTPKQEG